MWRVRARPWDGSRLARRRDATALAAFRAAEPLARRLAVLHYTVPRARALLVHALVRLGETEGGHPVADQWHPYDPADPATIQHFL